MTPREKSLVIARLRQSKAYEAEITRLRDALLPFIEGANHTLTFLRTKERMHPDGVHIYERDVCHAREVLFPMARPDLVGVGTDAQTVERPSWYVRAWSWLVS